MGDQCVVDLEHRSWNLHIPFPSDLPLPTQPGPLTYKRCWAGAKKEKMAFLPFPPSAFSSFLSIVGRREEDEGRSYQSLAMGYASPPLPRIFRCYISGGYGGISSPVLESCCFRPRGGERAGGVNWGQVGALCIEGHRETAACEKGRGGRKGLPSTSTSLSFRLPPPSSFLLLSLPLGHPPFSSRCSGGGMEGKRRGEEKLQASLSTARCPSSILHPGWIGGGGGVRRPARGDGPPSSFLPCFAPSFLPCVRPSTDA